MQKRTTRNCHDPFAVAVIDATGSIVGHVLLPFLQFQPFVAGKNIQGHNFRVLSKIRENLENKALYGNSGTKWCINLIYISSLRALE